MNTEDSRAIVDQFLLLSREGSIDACFELFSDDAVWSNIGTTRFSGDYVGKDAILNDLIQPLFAELEEGIRSEVETVIADGNKVVVLSQGNALTKSGRRYDNCYAQVFTLAGKQIVSVREYMDTALVDAVFGPP